MRPERRPNRIAASRVDSGRPSRPCGRPSVAEIGGMTVPELAFARRRSSSVGLLVVVGLRRPRFVRRRRARGVSFPDLPRDASNDTPDPRLLDNITRLAVCRWFVWLHGSDLPVSSIRTARQERSLAVADGNGAPGNMVIPAPSLTPKQSDKGESVRTLTDEIVSEFVLLCP